MSEWWIGNEKIGNEGKKISGTEYFYWFDKGNRFVEDKVIVDTQDFFILLDGVIFNKKEILKNCQQNNWSLTIIDLYKTGRLEFVNLLRGSFNGVVIDKISHPLLSLLSDAHRHSKYVPSGISNPQSLPAQWHRLL